MTLFDWLASPVGIDLTHAVIVLILAVASWVTYRTHRVTKANADRLDNHIAEHRADVAHTTDCGDPPASAHM